MDRGSSCDGTGKIWTQTQGEATRRWRQTSGRRGQQPGDTGAPGNWERQKAPPLGLLEGGGPCPTATSDACPRTGRG